VSDLLDGYTFTDALILIGLVLVAVAGFFVKKRRKK